jgi:cysteinyl-tRNA synthetase
MELYLYNSATKQKENFIPINENNISMYVCGPTVYSAPHLGNGLSVVVFDLLYRVLSYKYGKDKVTYVRNITDVDDKINDAATLRGIDIKTLTKEVTDVFHNNTKYLNCLEPNFEPTVTNHISEIISIIQKLIDNGYAYVSNNHVYFDVQKDANYGKLSGRNIDDLLAGVRIDVSDNKKHFADFVLWKPSHIDDDKSAVFESPWGNGRPGWHIECSAMSHKYLGADFDIHGGGLDLVFPHHTNEIAQSCNAFENSTYARYWLHNGFLTVAGEKMSKSLNNFITINDLEQQMIEGEVVRFHILSSHYRKPMDWNQDSIQEAKIILNNFYRATEEITDNQLLIDISLPEEFVAALYDDLNTPKAYTVLHKIYHQINKSSGQEKQQLALILKKCCMFLGFLHKSSEEWFNNNDEQNTDIAQMIEQRKIAKNAKNFQEADNIRQKLLDLGIILEDKEDGSTIWRRA